MMQDFTIFDTIRDYAGASQKLEAELIFIAEELKRIAETDPAKIDDETKALNAEIEERASTVFTIAKSVLEARRSALQRSLFALAYSIGPDDEDLIVDEDDVPDPDEAVRLAKLSIADLLGIDVPDADGADDEDDAEADGADAA